jgi:anti-sigma B factor antagonist
MGTVGYMSGTTDAAAALPRRRTRSVTWPCPNPSEFSLLVVTQNLDIVIQLCGELDLDALASLEECLEHATAEGPRRLVVDLSGLDFLDAAGIGALLRARSTAASSGVDFVLDSPTPPVHRVLDVTGVVGELVVR